MKIIDRLNEDGIHISFEVFPPKTDEGFDKVIGAVDEIATLNPAFISVTYGAGGGTSKNTARIASHIKDDLNVLSLAHLTCASSTKEEVRKVIGNLKELGIDNILALRGDIPPGMDFPDTDRFRFAYELVEEIRKHGDFCIGAACYPEGHVENEHKSDDIRFLKQKVDNGVDFLTTQMFFDNDIHYNFLYRIREAGITVRFCRASCDHECITDEKEPGAFGHCVPAQISCDTRSFRQFAGGNETGRNRICNGSDHRSAC